MKKDKASTMRRARALFEAREGEVTDKELCLNFNDEEVDYLFKQKFISPKDKNVWVWVMSPQAA